MAAWELLFGFTCGEKLPLALAFRSPTAWAVCDRAAPKSLPSRTVWCSDLDNYQRELSMVAGDVYLTCGPVRYAVYGFRNNLNLKEIVKVRRVMGNVYPSRVT